MGNNKKFILGFFLAFAVMTFACFAAAESWTESSTPDVKSIDVYVNDAFVMSGDCNVVANSSNWNCAIDGIATLALEKGETADVEVMFTAGNELDNARVKAEIRGYHEDIEAETAYFDIFAGNSYTKHLALDIPADMDEDEYTLYISIEDKNELSGVSEAEADINVQKAADMLKILSVDSYGSFEAGSVFYTDVVVKNTGSDKANDVYVSVSVPELGLSRTVYLGDLAENDDDDHDDTEKATISMVLPSSAKGSYMLNVKAYSSRFSVEETKNLVVSGTAGNGKVVITPQAVTADIGQGKGAVYTMTIANYGSSSVTVKVSTEGTEGWSEVQINPSTFVLAAGKTETVNVYVVANENAVEAEHVFTAEISYDNANEQISLSADVTKNGVSQTRLKTILTVIAVILAVAIIVLLIILLTRKESKAVAETYY